VNQRDVRCIGDNGHKFNAVLEVGDVDCRIHRKRSSRRVNEVAIRSTGFIGILRHTGMDQDRVWMNSAVGNAIGVTDDESLQNMGEYRADEV